MLRKRTKEELLKIAMNMPVAQPRHWRDPSQIPKDADPQHLRISNNPGLRSALLERHVIEGLQSPIGRDGCKSIFRIYPDCNAPPTPKQRGPGTYLSANPHAIRRRRNHVSSRNGSASDAVTHALAMRKQNSINELPTLEDLKAIITRIEALEGHLARELSMKTEEDIMELQKLIPLATNIEEVEKITASLSEAFEKRRNTRAHTRKAALEQAQEDAEFAQRKFLHLIAAT
jgi:hypothetical protein